MTGEPSRTTADLVHAAPIGHEVDPDRLAHGRWSPKDNRTVGEGDICASYSADTIANRSGVRRPFTFKNESWVCVGLTGAAITNAKAYRVQLRADFQGAATSYADKTRDCTRARRDPMGFYHGMAVSRGKQKLVLVGPPAVFRPSGVLQPGLFPGD